jgi:hypothetical protein
VRKTREVTEREREGVEMGRVEGRRVDGAYGFARVSSATRHANADNSPIQKRVKKPRNSSDCDLVFSRLNDEKRGVNWSMALSSFPAET